MRRGWWLVVGCWALLGAGLVQAVPATIKFRELYVRGYQLTEKAQKLTGQQVTMVGYMAPPLKPEIEFFVLTKLPMSVCPFCETEAEWPIDMVLVLTDQPVRPVHYTNLIRVTGTLETGFEEDPKTGFVSYVRLRDAEYRRR